MKAKFWQFLITAIGITLVFPTLALSHEKIFSSISFTEAKTSAKEENKLLLIDFTASWCPPCKKMESTTWADSEVAEWIEKNAIAIQVDVDENKSLTSKLGVKAMPTVILFSPKNMEEEYARQVGYLNSSDLLIWLNQSKDGKSSPNASTTGSTQNETWNHVSKAQQASASKDYQTALVEYIWLWKNVRGSSGGLDHIRSSMVPYELRKLASVHPGAREKILELRAFALESKNRKDWIILNAVLKEDKSTLAWFDKTKTDKENSKELVELRPQLERILFSSSRWEDAAKYLYPEPIKLINEYYKKAQKMKAPGPHTQVAKGFDPFPPMVTLVYGSYVGAGLDADAKKIEEECLRLDDTPAMRKVLSEMSESMTKARSKRTN